MALERATTLRNGPGLALRVPRETWVALDMAGCPNRCRHCYLGYLPTRRVDGAELRGVVARLRAWVRPGEAAPYLRHVQAHTWFREPDYRPDYRALYDLERELSGREPARFELLSIWRLARDPDYAAWARRIGTEACQVTFFGLEVTHDWFVRRRGSFQDSLVATERLLEAGIRPRWQIFFTQHILPELDALYALVDRLRLRERCEALGGPFQVFLHTPCPDGEAIGIEGLRPTVSALARVPAELLTASVAHIGRPLGEAEADIVARLRRCAEPAATRWGSAERLGFYVTSRLDVYTNPRISIRGGGWGTSPVRMWAPSLGAWKTVTPSASGCCARYRSPRWPSGTAARAAGASIPKGIWYPAGCSSNPGAGGRSTVRHSPAAYAAPRGVAPGYAACRMASYGRKRCNDDDRHRFRHDELQRGDIPQGTSGAHPPGGRVPRPPIDHLLHALRRDPLW